MKVKNIISLACSFTDNEDLADMILAETSDPRIDEMVKLFNLVRNEVATEYMPMCAKEKIEVKDFKVSFSQFAKKPLEIKAVKNKRGRNVKFKVFPDYLFVQASECEITYSFQPEALNFEDEMEECLPERVYAYGLAREYLLKEGMMEDAQIFEVRFKNSLKILLRKKSEVVMPGRRWV